MAEDVQFDLAIAGGGLAGGLTALALAKLRPELSVVLIEAEEHFGGNHIWSFFDSDIDKQHRWLVEPLIVHHWDSYDVHFPGFNRSLQTGYNAITSENFDNVLRNKIEQASKLTGASVKKLHAENVTLQDGRTIRSGAVLDARGGGNFDCLDYGWQKFAGQMLELKSPHGLDRPIVMDATVDQIDGYRFVYCLPFGAHELFVEDTYYSDGPDLNETVYQERIAGYARDNGWEISAVTRSESGKLPVVFGGKFDAFWAANNRNSAIGTRAALFHPVTSYSLPMAVRTAVLIAQQEDLSQEALDKLLFDHSRKHWRETKFYRMLCAMMFKAAKPEKRYLTLQHTYAKDQSLIERFYAGKTTMLDKVALLTGRPPVPITKALPIMMQYR